MKEIAPKTPSVRNYFVDEAGDAVLFGHRGKLLLGESGCSRYFMQGLLDVEDPSALGQDLTALRTELLADPYFKDVPSMQASAQKTAIAFHAKDDVPEVRREVFSALRRQKLRFLAVVKDKRSLLKYVRARNQEESSWRYHPDEVYDYLVRRLCKNLLHKEDEYNIVFARRGSSDRTAALDAALKAAQQRFFAQWGIASRALIRVTPAYPVDHAGLQAVDYFLWALQRFYERHESRYVELMWPSFRLVQDIDDTRAAGYGAYYDQKKPLTLAALDGRPGI